MQNSDSEPKRKTRIADVILVMLGLALFISGIYTWLSFNSLSGTFFSVLESQGYIAPSSISTKFIQITLTYFLVTIIGFLLIIVGIVNEVASLFEVK